jgi:adenosylcobinamide-GDP ribazoletransferase
MAMKQFGGINGDLAGCFLSVCELVMPLAAVAAHLVL